MVPQKEWRDKGSMMDKRTARKVHGKSFRNTIETIRKDLKFSKNNSNSSIINTSDEFKVYVRKRPILKHEIRKNEYDILTCLGDHSVVVHSCQMYADMKNKFVESHQHSFSKCFNESTHTDEVYDEVARPLLVHTMNGGQSVCMMYGQTGSGKTYTMTGFQEAIANDIFCEPEGNIDFNVSLTCVEITGSKCVDLLNSHKKLSVCEDEEGNVNLLGVSEIEISSPDEFMDIIEQANNSRATQSTAVNNVSSRSHSLCQINLRSNSKKLYGRLTLLDLAGSERNEDSFQHSADRRKEAIEINTSHMALKQCIRAMIRKDIPSETSGYVPYRASTLTRILKDSLWSSESKAAVIATISPIPTDTEHTLHTLQYAGMMVEDTPNIIKTKVEVNDTIVREKDVIPMRQWTHEQACRWLSKLRHGNFEKYIKNFSSSIDGKQLTRLSNSRFLQLCNGNSNDAEYLYNSIRKNIKKFDDLEKKRRELNRIRSKGRG